LAASRGPSRFLPARPKGDPGRGSQKADPSRGARNDAGGRSQESEFRSQNAGARFARLFRIVWLCGMAGGYRSSRSTASFGRGSEKSRSLAALGMTRGFGRFARLTRFRESVHYGSRLLTAQWHPLRRRIQNPEFRSQNGGARFAQWHPPLPSVAVLARIVPAHASVLCSWLGRGSEDEDPSRTLRWRGAYFDETDLMPGRVH